MRNLTWCTLGNERQKERKKSPFSPSASSQNALSPPPTSEAYGKEFSQNFFLFHSLTRLVTRCRRFSYRLVTIKPTRKYTCTLLHRYMHKCIVELSSPSSLYAYRCPIKSVVTPFSSSLLHVAKVEQVT